MIRRSAASLALALLAALPFVPLPFAASAAPEDARPQTAPHTAPQAASSPSDRREHAAVAAAAIDAGAAFAAVRAAGYGAVRDLEWEHGAWEVKAIDAEGRPTKLRVDAGSGAVSRRDR